MSSDVNLQEIPRYGGAGVAFLGVEVKQTYLLLGSIFVGLITGAQWGAPAYIGIPATGYFLTKIYLDWMSDHLPGSIRTFLYSKGIIGYSSGLRARKVIYHGDAVIMNKAFDEQELEMIVAYLEKNKNGH